METWQSILLAVVGAIVLWLLILTFVFVKAQRDQTRDKSLFPEAKNDANNA